MPIVYVVQQPMKFDKRSGELTPRFPDLDERAKELGEVRYLLSPSAAPWNSESILRDLRAGLANYSDEDYLLLVGNPVLIGLAVAVAAFSGSGRVRCLQWSGKDGRYVVVDAQVIPHSSKIEEGTLSPPRPRESRGGIIDDGRA